MAVFMNQDVLGLNITVNDVIFMRFSNRAGQLFHH
ncbi:hypothetical protein EVA_07568 [gut metagenome]|uniref:Uncharacterized protein n=1 Tax=gut metagenome TaxID=749906 RepID=J9GAJ8_9ZZZZ